MNSLLAPAAPPSSQGRERPAGSWAAPAIPTQQVSPFGFAQEAGAAFTYPSQAEAPYSPAAAVAPPRSPFTTGQGFDSVTLTVADLLPSLPPEIIRSNGAAPNQPVAISPQAIEMALSSGSHAVPLFEVYRVCPALFQTPISPHDPRGVALPMHRFAAGQQAPVTQHAYSPVASPFGQVEADPNPARPTTSLPPRRPAGTPPAIPTAADFSSPQLAAAGPVKLQLPPMDQPAMPAAAPYTPAPQAASPFGFAPPAQTIGVPRPISGSLKEALQAQPAPVPFTPSAAPAASIFSVASAGPPANPAPARPNDFLPVFTKPHAPEMARPTASQLPQVPLNQARSEDVLTLPLSTLFRGQSPEDLGFDPTFIPAWVNARLPAQAIRDQVPSGRVVLDLGTVIDGTDESFRTMIAHGRRDLRVTLAIQDVFHALPTIAGKASAPTNAATAPLPSTPSAAPAVQVGGLMNFPGLPLSPPPQTAAASTSASNIPPALPSRTPSITPSVLQALSKLHEPPAPHPAAAPIVQPARPISASLLPQHTQPTVQPAPAPILPPQPQPTHVPLGAFDPFAPSLGTQWTAPEPVRLTPASGPLSAPPQPPSTPAEGFSSAQLFGSASPPSAPLSPPMLQAAPAAREPAFTPARPPQPQAAPIVPEAPPPVAAAPAPTTPQEGLFFSSSSSAEPEQLLLRAILGVAEALDAERVVRLTAELPSILACICVVNNKAITHGNGEPAAHDFQQQAVDLARGVQSLSSVVGMGGAETFSVRSQERLVTFSLVRGIVFGVLHAGAEPLSGQREKITLIARELATLLHSRRS